MDPINLPSEILALDDAILYCAIVDRLGYRKAYKERLPKQFEVSQTDADRGDAASLAIRPSTDFWPFIRYRCSVRAS